MSDDLRDRIAHATAETLGTHAYSYAVADAVLPALADVWDDGFEAGWVAQDPDDHAPNPHRTAGKEVDHA